MVLEVKVSKFGLAFVTSSFLAKNLIKRKEKGRSEKDAKLYPQVKKDP